MRANSYDEWTTLREVVVGSPINYRAHSVDISFDLFFHDVRHGSFYYPSYKGSRPSDRRSPLRSTSTDRYLAELEEDVEEFVRTLEALNIVVHRPQRLSEVVTFRTPNWEAATIPALNVRDQVIVLGDAVLETAPQIRARYFENSLLNNIFYHYFSQGSRWLTMPRPTLVDEAFDTSYTESRPIPTIEAVKNDKRSCRYEMMLDGAQCLRLGRDVLVNVANANHELGFRWLSREFREQFRFHRLHRLADNHVDTKLLPLAPGRFLARSRDAVRTLPAPFNKWDVIVAPEPSESQFPAYGADDIVLTSPYIDLNVLSLDESTVVVNSLFPELLKVLDRAHLNVVPVRHRHRRLFGGGFHCFTVDTVRDGQNEDYS